jgi:hypothetical protein
VTNAPTRKPIVVSKQWYLVRTLSLSLMSYPVPKIGDKSTYIFSSFRLYKDEWARLLPWCL